MRRFYSLVSNLVNKCRSCGSILQSVDPKVAGYKPIVQSKPFIKSEDLVWNSRVSQMSEEDAKLLNWDPEKDFSKVTQASRPGDDRENHDDCLRCRNILHKSQTVPEPIIENASILDNIGPGKMVYVANSIDFPSSVNKSILTKYKPIVVLTKVDLIYKLETDFKKYPFFKQYFKTFGIPPENVYFTSHNKYWGFKSFYNYLVNNPETYYFVGDVNVGKSSLISRLVFRDKNINKKFVHWSVKNGPGISTQPGFTRDSNKFQITNSTIVDLPGLNGNKLKVDNFKDLKTISKNLTIPKRGLYNARYESIRKNQILTVGGLFYLRLPENENLVVQFKSLINHERLILKDLDKLLDLKVRDSLKGRFLVEPPEYDRSVDAFPYKRYLIPPFYGKIDVVLKNFGYIELKPTGPKSTNKLLEVLIPKDMETEVFIREPLHYYVSKVPTGRDKLGNPLKKENMHKSKRAAKSYDGRLIASKLIPWDGSDQYKAVSEFLTTINGFPVDYNENTEISEKNFKDYWFY